MKKQKLINLEQILARKIKGYAFMKYPLDGYESAQDYANEQRKLIELDYAKLSEEEFRAKYNQYIY